jgi:hypothetical protein
MTSERRVRRSSDPLVALHYQLTETRRRGGFEAVVLADPSGVVVAGSGSWPVCEELAAFAPLAERLAEEKLDMIVLPLSVNGALLCARGGHAGGAQEAREQALNSATDGVFRILAA